MFKHLGKKKVSIVVLEDIPAVYDYWPVACLLLYPGNALHHIKKTHSIQRNGALCPLREMEMEKIADLTTLWINYSSFNFFFKGLFGLNFTVSCILLMN